MRNVLLIDGNNLLYRNAVVMKNLTTKTGIPTGGILGTLKGISSSIKEVSSLSGSSISEVYLFFDGGRSERRLTLYPQYKGTRKKKEERTPEENEFFSSFFLQSDILYDFLPSLGVKVIKEKGWEADDLIYSLIDSYLKIQEAHFTILSTDEDFLQLLNPNVSVYSPIKAIYYTYENFRETFGIDPENFLSYKILKGDPSDNIPGVHGIGEKTSKKLVTTYGGLKGILDPINASQIRKSKVSARILESASLELIARNNQLINLKDFVDYTSVARKLEDARNLTPMIKEKEVRDFLIKYQLTSILVRFREWIDEYKRVNEAYRMERY